MSALGPEVPSGRFPLVLAPTGPRGWFGGRWLRAADPVDVAEGVSLADAGAALQAAFEAEAGSGDGPLVAAVLPYDGPATVLTYREWTGTRATEPASGAPGIAPGASTHPLVHDPVGTLSDREYRAAVRQVRERIAAGDVYVLNLTYTLSGRAADSPAGVFGALHARAGAEMSAYVETPDGALASVSPERFVRVTRRGEERVAEVWPIKGTRPRGADAASDAALAAELAADPKERAEHVMVVDLERNDLGRVSVSGSIAAAPLLEVVPTPYCHQMVSRVSGTLQPDATIADVLEATFPCGSVTGAPKLAAMRIAAGLERAPRDAYTGALVVACPGELDSSVLIRTAMLEGGRLSWGTGCGITCESDPAAEWLETLLKASPVLGDDVPPVALRETCRVACGRVPLLAYHLSRLAVGGCGPGLLARVRAEAGRALVGLDPKRDYGRLAITVHPDGSVTAECTDASSSLHVTGGPLAVSIEVAGEPALPPGAAKPADRGFWDAAQHQAGPGAQAVLVCADGTLLDGATATLWLRRGDELLTPPAPPAVAGVAREAVFDLAPECGFVAREACLTASDLHSAEEVFFTNALAGVAGARSRGGRATEALAHAFERELGFPVR